MTALGDRLRRNDGFRVQGLLLWACVALLPLDAQAHAFGQIYNLPVPYWLYVYGAVAALVLSFVVVAYFATVRRDTRAPATRSFGDAPWLNALRRWLLPLLRWGSVGVLLLCIATGFFGSRDPYRNFNMTAFWIVFALGMVYLTALIGDWYTTLSPWRVLADGIGRLWRGFTRGRLAYPRRLAYWPALAFFMGFIWIELFAHTRPFSLAAILCAYTAINLAGAWLIGAQAWFRYCEFFAVMLRLIAMMAPVACAPPPPAGEGARRAGEGAGAAGVPPSPPPLSRKREGGDFLSLRPPLRGLTETRAEHLSLLVFILFMLSSTAFDGLRATSLWFGIFWKDAFGIFAPLVGDNPIKSYVQLRALYVGFESFCLLLSPFVYLALYWVFVWLGKVIVRSPLSTMELALRFALSLLPIALVYHVTHYYTLLLSQGAKIVALVSDPFGWNWDLFGTALTMRRPILLDMGFVWHSQVALILAGHVAAVYLAHVEALHAFQSRTKAALNQLPMLVLMVLFTAFGLWILAQPLQRG